MSDIHLDIGEMPEVLALAGRVRQGRRIVLEQDGVAVAVLQSPAMEPAHRAKESRKRVTISAEFEPVDARLHRLTTEGGVPHAFRDLPAR